MSEVRELLVIVVATVLERTSTPDDIAGLGRQQPRYAAEETRLADAIRADDLQQLAALQDERRTAQKVPLAAPQVHGTNVELRLGCGLPGLCVHGCCIGPPRKPAVSLSEARRHPAVATRRRRHATTVPAHTARHVAYNRPAPLPGWRNW